MTLPTSDDVVAAVETCEPATVMDVLRALDAPWEQRGTVRNRLDDLAAGGVLITDEERPRRYALNHLA